MVHNSCYDYPDESVATLHGIGRSVYLPNFQGDATEPCDQQADVTIGINYYGTKLVTSILLPLIRSGGR